jgi:hypothetical protein
MADYKGKWPGVVRLQAIANDPAPAGGSALLAGAVLFLAQRLDDGDDALHKHADAITKLIAREGVSGSPEGGERLRAWAQEIARENRRLRLALKALLEDDDG